MTDGDTITILTADKEPFKIRLNGIDALAAKRGLWAFPNPVPPWEFRHGRPLTSTASDATAIIGNRNSRIYHLPSCPDYAKVPERNRVPFATAAEAEQAGFRRATNCP